MFHANKIPNGRYIGLVTTKVSRGINLKICGEHNYKNIFLGYHNNEIDGAKAYNDHALFLNETENCKYLINNIENYNTVARNKEQVKLFHKRV